MTNEELATRIQSGDTELIPQLWEQVRKLIYVFVNRYYRKFGDRCAASGVTEEDLLQEGFLAVMDAAKAYSPDGDYKFTAYLHFPVSNRFKTVTGAIKNRRTEPLNHCSSLNEPILGSDGGESGSERLDFMEDIEAQNDFENCERTIYLQQLKAALDECLSMLQEDCQTTLRRRYFNGETLQAISKSMGVSMNMVRQQECYGLRRLRHSKAKHKLLPFLYTEISEQEAYRGSGFKTFSQSGASSVERALERMEQMTARRML